MLLLLIYISHFGSSIYELYTTTTTAAAAAAAAVAAAAAAARFPTIKKSRHPTDVAGILVFDALKVFRQTLSEHRQCSVLCKTMCLAFGFE